MKPHLVDLDAAAGKLKALEQGAEAKLEKAVAMARGPRMQSRRRRLDASLTAIGAELAGLLIIALALAILCAPIGLGLAAVWFAGTWVAGATGSAFLGWVAAMLIFTFLCCYVWGVRLQSAARRAAMALIAGK